MGREGLPMKPEEPTPAKPEAPKQDQTSAPETWSDLESDERLIQAWKTKAEIAEAALAAEKERAERAERALRGTESLRAKRAKDHARLDVARRTRMHVAESEVTRLREVLEWYADEGNYVADDAGAALATAWQGGGIAIKAREALALKMFKDEQLRIAAGEEGGSDAAE